MYDGQLVKIVNKDALIALRDIPDNSIDCIVTSPPYRGLRDYKINGQIGLERTLSEYLNRILRITADLKRVLKPTGTMWWVHGNSYDSKCLTLQAQRLAIRMIDEQGWVLRNCIIWEKPNRMPSPVRDRLTNAYETVLLFAKTNKIQFYVNRKTLRAQIKKPLGVKGKEGIDWEYGIVRSDAEELALQRQCEEQGKGRTTAGLDHKGYRKQDTVPSPIANMYRGFNARWQGKDDGRITKRKPVSLWFGVNYYFDLDAIRETPVTGLGRVDILRGKGTCNAPAANSGRAKELEQKGFFVIGNHPLGKNPGDVWHIPTEPRPDAHFACFPRRLVRRILEVAAPKEVCPVCGLPRVRVFQPTGEFRWSDCGCGRGWVPGLVLDPFLGSGTTAEQAVMLGLSCIGIEINPDYCKMAEQLVAKSLIRLPIEVNKCR